MTYDGLGRLEGIGTSTQVIWGPSGEKLGYLVSGTLVSSLKLPGGGEASYNGSSLTAVRHKDWLGSSRLATTWSHGILSKTAYAPFGETYNTSGRADGDFTGMTEDASTDLADFPARKYDANANRWTVPDPGAWSVVDYKHPQSFNRYAYARNNPLKFIDPAGLTVCQYGPNNDGSGNYEEADDEQECWDNGGTVYENQQTVTATANVEDDEGYIDWEIDQPDGTNPLTPVGGPDSGLDSGPNLMHIIGCSIAAPVLGMADASGETSGAGIGGSAGIGLLLGYSASLGLQVVGDTQGNAGLAFNFSGAGPFPVLGAGAQGGGQLSMSTASSIYGLEGDSLDFNGSIGLVGVDVSHASGGATTGTVTLGPGVGGKTAAFGTSSTTIVTSTNCQDMFP